MASPRGGSRVGTMFGPYELRSLIGGQQADIYALACLLYEGLTGHPPCPVADLGALMRSHMLSPPPRPSVARTGLNSGFDVVARGMAGEAARGTVLHRRRARQGRHRRGIGAAVAGPGRSSFRPAAEHPTVFLGVPGRAGRKFSAVRARPRWR